MPLPEHQEYLNQITLLNKKLLHLEETLKLEEEEGQLKQKIDFHQANSLKEAEIAARKEEETSLLQKELQEEEAGRHAVFTTMENSKDDSLSPIKDVLVHLEGNSSRAVIT